jgi:hypothetical protein
MLALGAGTMIVTAVLLLAGVGALQHWFGEVPAPPALTRRTSVTAPRRRR